MRNKIEKFNLKAFEELTTFMLKPSDYVDLLLYLSRLKSCVRLGYNNNEVYKKMIYWCKNNNFSFIISEEGFMYISKNYLIAWLAKVIDNSTWNHTLLLGLIFGYPRCCSKKVASIGENNIDNYEKELLMNNKFNAPFDIINPQGYTNGYSLISHIPCCSKCRKSLKIANKIYKIVNKYKDSPSFQNWKNHW